MAQTDNSNTVTDLETYREYILGVRITERTTADGETRYRFEAPDHQESHSTTTDMRDAVR